MSVTLRPGIIQFRHPLILDGKGYGKVIRRGIGKFSEVEQAQIKADLDWLLEFKPTDRASVKRRLHPVSLQCFFDAQNADLRSLLAEKQKLEARLKDVNARIASLSASR